MNHEGLGLTTNPSHQSVSQTVDTGSVHRYTGPNPSQAGQIGSFYYENQQNATSNDFAEFLQGVQPRNELHDSKQTPNDQSLVSSIAKNNSVANVSIGGSAFLQNPDASIPNKPSEYTCPSTLEDDEFITLGD